MSDLSNIYKNIMDMKEIEEQNKREQKLTPFPPYPKIHKSQTPGCGLPGILCWNLHNLVVKST